PRSTAARFSHLMRAHRLGVLVSLVLAGGTALPAQTASPYVPIGYWGMPAIEHLIARHKLVDPAPLTRPLRAADLVRALQAVDTMSLGAAERDLVGRILADLAVGEHGPSGRLEGHLGAAAATH